MDKDIITPEIGTTCPALTKENYDYHLSGNAYTDYNKCMLNGRTCMGVIIEDPQDRSSTFFSRGKACIDKNEIKKCPIYGSSKETIKMIVEDKAKQELAEKLKFLG